VDLSKSFFFEAGQTYHLALHAGMRTLAKTSPQGQPEPATFSLQHPPLAMVSRTSSVLPAQRHTTLSAVSESHNTLSSFRFISCSSSRTTTVNNAANVARSAVQSIVANYWNKGCLDSTYSSWYGTYNVNNYVAVRGSYTRMSQLVSNAAFDCSPPSSECGDAIAYVYPTDTSMVIHLCAAYWPLGASLQPYDSKPGSLIHELSHFASIGETAFPPPLCVLRLTVCAFAGGTQDYVYGPDAAGALASSQPEQAIYNADKCGRLVRP
jgi:hypothetical protein